MNINLYKKENVENNVKLSIYSKNIPEKSKDKLNFLSNDFNTINKKFRRSHNSQLRESYKKEKINFSESMNGYYHISSSREKNIYKNNKNLVEQKSEFKTSEIIVNDNSNENIINIKNENNSKEQNIILKENNELEIEKESKISLFTSDDIIYDTKEEYEDGSSYCGEIINNKKNGKGILILKNNSKYEGEWVNNKITGYGKLTNSKNEIIYKGNFLENNYDGYGFLYNLDNFENENYPENYYKNLNEIKYNYYEGLFKKNFKNGIGEIYFYNEDHLICEFKEDKCNGLGILKMKNKTIFGF